MKIWWRIRRIAYAFYAWWNIRETPTDGILVSREQDGSVFYLEFPVKSRTRWRSYLMVALDAESLGRLSANAAAVLERDAQLRSLRADAEKPVARVDPSGGLL